jgi:hypothetical protein
MIKDYVEDFFAPLGTRGKTNPLHLAQFNWNTGIRK